jgi:hypothetical protein
MPDDMTADSVLIAEIVTSESYHVPLVQLAARYAGRGHKEIVATLRGFMEVVPVADRDARWRQRVAEIPAIVRSATAKYAPVIKPGAVDDSAPSPSDGKYTPEFMAWLEDRQVQKHRAMRDLMGMPPAAQREPTASKSYAAMLADKYPAKPAGAIQARVYEWRDPSEIPPREWIYGRHYIRQFLSATFAPGGLGKSSLAIVESLDMVTGRGLLTDKPARRQHRVWYHCGEDPLEEIERRVAAVCKHYEISPYEMGDRLFVTSGRESPVIIASQTRDGATIARPVVEGVLMEMIEKRIDVLILDPFVSTHTVTENDNNAMNAVARAWAEIADTADASIELIHHVRKQTGQSVGQDRTAADGRGAGALVDAARSVRVLNVMATDEGDALGIPAEQRRLYFRVDSGKANLVPPSDAATWRHLASVDLENGTDYQPSDLVGVVEPWERPAVGAGVTDAHVAEFRQKLADGAPNRRDIRSSSWAGYALADILGWDAGDRAARKRVQAILERLISTNVVKVAHESNGKGRTQECVAPGPNASLPPQFLQLSVG